VIPFGITAVRHQWSRIPSQECNIALNQRTILAGLNSDCVAAGVSLRVLLTTDGREPRAVARATVTLPQSGWETVDLKYTLSVV